MKRTSTALAVASVVLVVVFTRWPQSPNAPADEPTPVARALGGNALDGYQRADRPRTFVFPADHGPHPDYRVEWWYLTGNLDAVSETDLEVGAGRAFGYQLTLFRIALTPDEPVADSPWRGRQLYMGHFALSDVTAGQHHAFERFSRAAPDLAGARATPFEVWLEDWSLKGSDHDAFPMRVRAAENGYAIDLRLEPLKPLVLQGERGLSQKSAEPGNASYYYSATRLASRGTVTTADGEFQVAGHSWLDREWSTSALGRDQTGWDWFALQLDDGRELMFYRLRRSDGSSDPHSSGVLVDADGTSHALSVDDVILTADGTWTSPTSGDSYPAGWQLKVPSEQLELRVRPVLPDQEMRLSVRYWEGAVTISGSAATRPVSGRGYLEMTRYTASH